MSAIVDKFGHVDLLFANAGTGKFAPLVDMQRKDWDTIIQVNLNGTFYICQAVARRMMERGRGGRVVLTASSGSLVVADQLGAYCTSKAAVMMMMKQFASELGGYRIAFNAVMPGVVATGMTEPMLERPEWRRMLERGTPSDDGDSRRI